MLRSFKETYIKFKETHTDIAISFTKFSKLKAKWSIPSGAHGTQHTPYVYIHQKMKLDADDRQLFISGGNDKYVCFSITVRMRTVYLVHVLLIQVQKH
jgi:hypothetical protein